MTSAVAAWSGFIIAVRRELNERTKLTFLFEASDIYATDSDGQEYRTPAIHVTVTNNGMRPISLDRVVCVFTPRYSADQSQSRKESSFRLAKLGRGDAADVWVELYSEPAEIIQILAIDSTAKKWVARHREIKAIQTECARLWPRKKSP